MREVLLPLLARVSRKRSVGLVIDDEALTVSQVVHTPLGPVERDRHSVPLESDPLDKVIRRALAPVWAQRGWKGAPVAIGLPTPRFLLTHRVLGPLNREASGEAMLHESMQYTNVLIDDLAIDTLRDTHARRPTATIVAARKHYLEPLLESVMAAGVTPHTVEPAAFGLLRWAARRWPAPQRARPIYRVFLGQQSALLVLACGSRPLGWRGFSMPAGTESEALAAVIGPLRTLAQCEGDEALPRVLMLHGRSDLRAALTGVPLWKTWELDVWHRDAPGLDDPVAALGVASGCGDEDDGFNLARALRPRRSLAEVFPWGQLVLQGAILASASGVMMSQLADLETRLSVLNVQGKRHDWLRKLTAAQLTTEKTDLTTRAELITAYLETRYQWANYLREVAGRLPASMGITSFGGKCTFVPPGTKGKAVQSLALQIEAPLPPGTSVPADIKALLDNLRATPLLQRTLAKITLSDLQREVSRETGGLMATFGLVCTPVEVESSKAKGKAQASKGEKSKKTAKA
jgi:hypothetical protein